MSLRGEFCRVLDKYKSGKWDRDKSAAALEKYFNTHQTAEIIAELERLKEWNGATIVDGKRIDGIVHRQVIEDRIKELKAKETQL